MWLIGKDAMEYPTALMVLMNSIVTVSAVREMEWSCVILAEESVSNGQPYATVERIALMVKMKLTALAGAK